ncbi:hypothetical protein ACIP93_25290 [Streptomyces sp. NPDC088745]|uniref:hypothetical protein n=1 Tax=Streptomyces sp. NPDC088745 TaxID=3365884 RepID=UPI00380C3936
MLTEPSSSGADGAELVRSDGAELIRSDGQREEVDAVVLTTGCRPGLPYPTGLVGALDADRNPRHREGVATGVPGLGCVGLERQRSLSPNSLRGAGRDAERVARRPAARLTRR